MKQVSWRVGYAQGLGIDEYFTVRELALRKEYIIGWNQQGERNRHGLGEMIAYKVDAGLNGTV